MPDFDTRRPQVPSRPNRLSVLFNGGTLLYVLVVASTVGLLIDAFSELAPQPTAIGEAPNGTIAFETTRDFPYDQVAEAIWVMNANGSELRRLMGAASPYSVGWSISQDGEKIAFTEALYEEVFCNNQAGCPEKVHAQINVMNADGSGKTQLVPDGGYEVGNPCQRPTQAISPGESLAWSPEGENIAFVDADNFVCVVNADGSGHPTLVRRVQSETMRNLEWLPPR